jgi:rare lipoprotein A (peptidoglycan hydrolase)
MTMRTKLANIFALLAVLASGMALAALGPANAQASTGGASAPSARTQAGGVAQTGGPAGQQAIGYRVAIATWFGPGFYGQTTACGQVLSHAMVGVAHRTLPCGTLVEVSYGGRRLTLPVVDRGPYAHNGAAWDLTSGAARALGIKQTVRLGALVVGSAPNTPTLGLPLGAVAPSGAATTPATIAPAPAAVAAAATGGATAG